MRLDGMTIEQCELLDKMWALETVEELKDFIESQDFETQREIMTLRELLILGGIDEDVEQMSSYPEAEKLLKSILK